MGKRLAPAALLALALLAAGEVPAVRAGWSVGVSIGAPLCHRPAPYCYRPYYPVYVRPAPVYVQPVTVIERVPAYVVPAPSVSRAPDYDYAPPAETPAPAPRRLEQPENGDIDRYTRKLQHTDPKERAEGAVQLGRLRAPGAVVTLTSVLNNDRSALVREAAARGLGLVGTSEALTALQRAALADEDKEVRQSAAYASDVIRASFSKR